MGIRDYRTVKNFADDNGVTVGYIYRLIDAGRVKAETIDGVKFIDVSKVKFKFRSKKSN